MLSLWCSLEVNVVSFGSSHRVLRVAAFAWIASLAWTSVASASHFRFAHLTWRKRADLAANTVEFTYYASYRRSSFSGTAADGRPAVGNVVNESALQFGDSTSASGNYLVLAIDITADWWFGRAVVSPTDTTTPILHTYASAGPFTARTSSCCRISTLLNSSDANYTISTVVDLTKETNSPVSNLPPIVNVAPNGVQTFNLAAADADSDLLTFRLAGTGSESGLTLHPPGLSVNASTGVVSWDTTELTLGLYTTQIIIESRDRTNNLLKTSVAIDFILNLTNAQLGNAPQFVRPPTPAHDSTITTPPGQAVTFTLQAQDSDVGSTVTLNAVGLPQGSTVQPTLPTTGNPVSSAFAWTPTANDLGPHVIVFIATDNTGQQTLNTITVTVAITVFQVTYNPGFSMISLPCDIANPVSVFGAGVQIAGWDAASQSYQLGNTFPLTRGIGYWIKLTSPVAVTLPNCQDNSLLRWNLRRGWNLIGNGYNVDLPWLWANLRVVFAGQTTPLTTPTQVVSNFAWNYNGATYRLVVDPAVAPSIPASLGTPLTVIPKGQGVWIFANEDGAALEYDSAALNLARTLRSSAVTRPGTFASRTRWIGTLRASVGATGSDSSTIGFDVTLAEATMRHQKPPTAPGGSLVDLAILGDHGERLASDLRRSLPVGQGWELVVTTPAREEEVQLTWPGLGSLPPPYRMTLVDLATGTRRSMRATAGYSFRAQSTGATARRFRIEVTAAAGALSLNNLALSRVGNGYRLSYSLTRPAMVAGRLINPAGKVLKSLPATTAGVGLNSVTFAAADAQGRTAARGVYLFELVAQDEEGNQAKALQSLVVK